MPGYPISIASSHTGHNIVPTLPPALRAPLITLATLYLGVGWILDGTQLALSNISLARGPVADSDPDGVYLSLPGVTTHLQRLAIAWASLGVVAHTVLGFASLMGLGGRARGLWDGPDGGVGSGRVEEGVVRGNREAARRMLVRRWLPWSVVSLGAWGVYVGLQTGVYVPRVGESVPECGEYPGLSQCQLLVATWVVGLVYIAFNLVLLGWIGFVFRRFGTACLAPSPASPPPPAQILTGNSALGVAEVIGVAGPSAPDVGEVIGVADAPQWWRPS